MTLEVWKQPLDEPGTVVISMPAGAEPMSFQMQGDVPTLWLLVDPKAPKVDLTMMVVGTGWPIKTDGVGALMFIGTVQFGRLVFHAFWVRDF